MKIQIPNIDFYFINSESRKDRLSHIEDELKKYNISATRFEAITNPENYDINFCLTKNPNQAGQWTKGQKGCYLSHKILLESYKSDKILGILEDDVIFCEDFLDRMKYVENNFDLDWDMFFLSSFYHLNSDKNRWNENGDYEFTNIKYVHRTYGSFTTHSYLVNPKSIEKILKKMDEFFEESYAIDHLYILIQPHLNVFSFTPGMTNQIVSYSDVVNNTKDQTMFKKICGEHYFANKLTDFNYDEYFSKNK